jgi:flagellar protein FliL
MQALIVQSIALNPMHFSLAYELHCITPRVTYASEGPQVMTLDMKAKPKADGKQKIESKPIVENKTDVVPERKSHKLWIIIGILVLVAVVSLAFLAFPYFKGMKGSSFELAGKPNQNSKHEPVKASLALEPFQVNLADVDELFYVKATFHLGLAEELEEESKAIAVNSLRDSIISLLSSKKADEILTPQGKDKLREEILLRANALSPSIKVVEVYIVDFIVHL